MPSLLLTAWDAIKSSGIGILVAAGLGMFAIIGGLSILSQNYTLGGIKSRTVGDGQHGTARKSVSLMLMYPSQSATGAKGKTSPLSRDWYWVVRGRKTN